MKARSITWLYNRMHVLHLTIKNIKLTREAFASVELFVKWYASMSLIMMNSNKSPLTFLTNTRGLLLISHGVGWL